MALNANNVKMAGGNKRPRQEPMDAGTYPARVVQVLDLGVQEQRPYKGTPKPPVHEIMLTYEFLDEFCKDEDGKDDPEKPRWLSEEFPFNNLKADLAKSTKRYHAIDPTGAFGGDFTLLVGQPCMVTVVQNPRVKDGETTIYNNIAGVASMRAKEAEKAAPLVNPTKVFLLDEPDLEVFNALPEFLQEKIKKNLNYRGSALEKLLTGGTSANNEQSDKEPSNDNW